MTSQNKKKQTEAIRSDKEKETRPFFMSYLLIYETIDKDEAAVFCFLLNRQKVSGFSDVNGKYCITSRTEIMQWIKGFTKWKLNEVMKSLRSQGLIRTVITRHGLRVYVNQDWENLMKEINPKALSLHLKCKDEMSGIHTPDTAEVLKTQTPDNVHVSDFYTPELVDVSEPRTPESADVSGEQTDKRSQSRNQIDQKISVSRSKVSGEQTDKLSKVSGEQTDKLSKVSGEQTLLYKEELKSDKELMSDKELVEGVVGGEKTSSLPSTERETSALSPHPANPQADVAHPLPKGEGLNWNQRLKELSALPDNYHPVEEPYRVPEPDPAPESEPVPEDTRSEEELVEMMEQIDQQRPEWEQESWFPEVTSVCNEENNPPADPTGVSLDKSESSSPAMAKNDKLPNPAESSPKTSEMDKPLTAGKRLAEQQSGKSDRSDKKADKSGKAGSKSKKPAEKKKPARKTTKTGALSKAGKLELCRNYARSHDDPFLEELLPDWVAIRVAKQAAETETAYRRQFAKIDRFSKEAGISRGAYLNFLIDRGWKGAYALDPNQVREAKSAWKEYLSQSDQWKKISYKYTVVTTCNITAPYGIWDSPDGTDEEMVEKATHTLSWPEQQRLSRLDKYSGKMSLPDGTPMTAQWLAQKKAERERKETAYQQERQRERSQWYSYPQTGKGAEDNDLPF